MLLCGTTTFTDMYYFEDVVAEAAKEAGMRGVLGRDHHRLPGGRQQDSRRCAGLYREVPEALSRTIR